MQKLVFLGYGVNKQDSVELREGGGGRAVVKELHINFAPCGGVMFTSYPNTAHFCVTS